MKKSYKRKKGPVQSKKISYDGINFASGLERYMYMALRKAKITSLYEGQTFELSEAFDFPFQSYERCGNGKGEYKNRGNKKILNIKYTPDFVGKGFIIETKGRANERLGPLTLYKPQNHKECDETVRLILEKQND